MNPSDILKRLAEEDVTRLLAYAESSFSCHSESDADESAHEVTADLRHFGLVRRHRKAADPIGHVTYEITPLGYEVTGLAEERLVREEEGAEP